jgi:hypothetical protein
MIGGITGTARGPSQMARQVRTPTSRVGSWTSEGSVRSDGSGTWRGTPSIAGSCDTRISTATAFWKPAMTGEGM